jgi:hypothetical protein
MDGILIWMSEGAYRLAYVQDLPPTDSWIEHTPPGPDGGLAKLCELIPGVLEEGM